MKRLLLTTLTALSLSVTASGAQATDISLGRFFGACENAGTDISKATGEACIIQSIINAYSEADNNVNITTLPTDWGNYYDQVKAAYAGGNAPDVHVLHRSRLAEFAELGALADLSDDLETAGIDTTDWTETAQQAVTYNDKIYAVPMDFHANLWHINMDLMAEADLVKDGKPILPSSPEELLQQAQQFKEATGKDYLAADFAQFPIGVRVVLALLWQQNANIFADGTATINTPEALNAVKAITQLFDAELADPKLNYADSEKAFLNGEAGISVNGTWVVDSYNAQAEKAETALDNYQVADFPTLFAEDATWADSHVWAIPASVKRDAEEKYQAALKFLAFLNEHNIDWARTGHMAVRSSVLDSEAYTNLPHREEYKGTAAIARDTPASEQYGAIQDVLNRELQAIWLTGKAPEEALAIAEEDVQSILD